MISETEDSYLYGVREPLNSFGYRTDDDQAFQGTLRNRNLRPLAVDEALSINRLKSAKAAEPQCIELAETVCSLYVENASYRIKNFIQSSNCFRNFQACHYNF